METLSFRAGRKPCLVRSFLVGERPQLGVSHREHRLTQTGKQRRRCGHRGATLLDRQSPCHAFKLDPTTDRPTSLQTTNHVENKKSPHDRTVPRFAGCSAAPSLGLPARWIVLFASPRAHIRGQHPRRGRYVGSLAAVIGPGWLSSAGKVAVMARTPDGPPPAPVVQKLRVRYAKRGRLRFSSTRDFQRALERALRRAAVPMAFSAGFHPHPKISYANAAPTGTASEAEYFEISVNERVDPQRVRAALDEALPEGLDVLEVVGVLPGSPALADRLQASDWMMEFRSMPVGGLADAVAQLLAQDSVEVTRVMKKGPRTFDVRGAVVSLVASPAQDGSCAILKVVVRHTTPAVRPDDVLTALQSVAFTPPIPPLVTRLAQGPLDTATATVTDPLVADWDVDGI